MTRVISFERFVALNEAGVDARATKACGKVVQLHSANEDFSAAIKRRTSERARRGY